jgi:hypothetical protein
MTCPLKVASEVATNQTIVAGATQHHHRFRRSFPRLLGRPTSTRTECHVLLQGEEVLVHADHVAKFDKVNGAPEDTPAPKESQTPAQGA